MNADFLIKILGTIKGLALSAFVPLISKFDPAVGKSIQDASDAFADGKLTLEEAETLAIDALTIGKEKVPQLAAGFEASIEFVKNDIPFIANTLIPDIEKIVKAFEGK